MSSISVTHVQSQLRHLNVQNDNYHLLHMEIKSILQYSQVCSSCLNGGSLLDKNMLTDLGHFYFANFLHFFTAII